MEMPMRADYEMWNMLSGSTGCLRCAGSEGCSEVVPIVEAMMIIK
jgi:hypothetical protein